MIYFGIVLVSGPHIFDSRKAFSLEPKMSQGQDLQFWFIIN